MEINTEHNERDIYWMSQALVEAQKAYAIGEVPVGAVLVADNRLIASAYNQPITSHNPTAHAEMEVLRKAAAELQNYRLVDTCLYVTLEPCTMCYGAMVHSRIARLVYGATEPKAGVIQSQLQLGNQSFYNHHFAVTANVMAEECGQLLSDFFAMRRAQKKAK